jgi:hypothetical protein
MAACGATSPTQIRVFSTAYRPRRLLMSGLWERVSSLQGPIRFVMVCHRREAIDHRANRRIRNPRKVPCLYTIHDQRWKAATSASLSCKDPRTMSARRPIAASCQVPIYTAGPAQAESFASLTRPPPPWCNAFAESKCCISCRHQPFRQLQQQHRMSHV